MQTLFKLTAQDGATFRGYEYGEVGRVHTKPFKKNPQLCSSDVFHAYRNKNLAFLLNPIHAGIKNPRLWKIKGDVVCNDFGKVGSFHQEVVRELEVPEWVGSEKDWKVRLTFAILCAEELLDVFESDDRPRKVIEMARKYLNDPSSVIVQELLDAARAAVNAEAYAAADAADVVAYAAHTAAHAAYAANGVAYAAACAAANAARAKDDIGIAALADKAVSLINNG